MSGSMNLFFLERKGVRDITFSTPTRRRIRGEARSVSRPANAEHRERDLVSERGPRPIVGSGQGDISGNRRTPVTVKWR